MVRANTESGCKMRIQREDTRRHGENYEIYSNIEVFHPV